MGLEPVVIDHAEVVVIVDGHPVGEAKLEISGVPDRAITGWALVDVELWADAAAEVHHPSAMRCCFKDPTEAFAFVGAVEPGRFGKDQ